VECNNSAARVSLISVDVRLSLSLSRASERAEIYELFRFTLQTKLHFTFQLNFHFQCIMHDLDLNYYDMFVSQISFSRVIPAGWRERLIF
jgi:hypothetical protein